MFRDAHTDARTDGRTGRMHKNITMKLENQKFVHLVNSLKVRLTDDDG